MGKRCVKERPGNLKEANVPKAYGVNMPPEWRLQRMYKQLKVDNTNFTTWLVESVYPTIESLPSYITLSRKQAKHYPKYEIVVNMFTKLAGQTQNVPSDVVALLDRLIDERTEYTYWMSRKPADQKSKAIEESHAYYIEVLKATKIILAERMVPATATAATAATAATVATAATAATVAQPGSSHAKVATTSSKTNISTLGKRRNSSTALQGPDQRKAAKREDEWRQIVTTSCDKMREKCTPAIRPMSYAAALRVPITA